MVVIVHQRLGNERLYRNLNLAITGLWSDASARSRCPGESLAEATSPPPVVTSSTASVKAWLTVPEVLEKLDAAETVKSTTVGGNLSIMGFGGGVTRRT